MITRKPLCTKCGVEQTTQNTRRRGASLYSWCRPCENTKRRLAYKNNPAERARRKAEICRWKSKNKQRWDAYAKKYRLDLKLKAIKQYGGKCLCCGETELAFMTIDHINGGGNKHRKTMRAMSFYRWLEKNNYPTGYQTLCWNCNAAKGLFGTCPHQLKKPL